MVSLALDKIVKADGPPRVRNRYPAAIERVHHWYPSGHAMQRVVAAARRDCTPLAVALSHGLGNGALAGRSFGRDVTSPPFRRAGIQLQENAPLAPRRPDGRCDAAARA